MFQYKLIPIFQIILNNLLFDMSRFFFQDNLACIIYQFLFYRGAETLYSGFLQNQ